MDYKNAFEILEIDINEIKYNDITLLFLKKQYRKLALRNHPDKNSNTPESNKQFQKINEAYHYLKREIKHIDFNNNDELEKEDDSEVFKSSLYFDILKSFMETVFEGKYNDFLSKIVNDIIISGKKTSIKLFDNLDKDTALHIYSFLSNNRNILHLSEDVLDIIRDIVVKKYDDVEIYKLNPSINDLINNNLYKLYFKDQLFLVPLWHNESYFDISGCEIMVICEPELDKDISIDDDNNICINVEILGLTHLVDMILNNKSLEFNIADKVFNIPVSNLHMKSEQYYRIKNEGLSKIKKDIYDVTEKTDIIVKIKII